MSRSSVFGAQQIATMDQLTCTVRDSSAKVSSSLYEAVCQLRGQESGENLSSPQYVTPYLEDVKETFIMAVEHTCLLIAGILMLITIIILIVGTIIVSCCSRDDEIDYRMIPQGDWHPEHLDYDNILDLLQSIQKSKKFQNLQEFLAQGKHLVHLNDS
ncbi:uncharacterized protein LOC133187777 isoform X1 [Saccostrea echinata]|uniref:uncharacterized protein LOC133187777 isoform X1 n=1 Tax=Saccostrea echinata TaxID=191078 RepID=UPI002A816892|nr:uncharacterized protein LOC133187777 isoform X1 [Saccostrea echinata]